MASPTRSLLVCGGSGFLGSRICKLAVARNWTVTSLSRSGEPSAWADSPPGGGSGRPDWADRVAWLKGDVMSPETYRGALEGVDAVVHSMGILLEADYKGVLAGRESVVGGLRRAFDSARHTADNTVRTGNPQLTYETMNRDTGMSPHSLLLCMYVHNTMWESDVDGGAGSGNTGRRGRRQEEERKRVPLRVGD